MAVVQPSSAIQNFSGGNVEQMVHTNKQTVLPLSQIFFEWSIHWKTVAALSCELWWWWRGRIRRGWDWVADGLGGEGSIVKCWWPWSVGPLGGALPGFGRQEFILSELLIKCLRVYPLFLIFIFFDNEAIYAFCHMRRVWIKEKQLSLGGITTTAILGYPSSQTLATQKGSPSWPRHVTASSQSIHSPFSPTLTVSFPINTSWITGS